MICREIGGSGLQASAVALGAWAIGGWMWGGQEESESIRAIQVALDSGINFIDTAPIYGYGRSEEVVGQAIAGRRHEVVLATKCGLIWEGPEPRRGEYHFSADEAGIQQKEQAKYHIYRYLGAESIRRELEVSLRRLRTDWIDLYQTHWQDGSTPIEETMEALLRLKEEGKIRAIGVSNATVEQMEQYRKVGPLDSDQEKYSALSRKMEETNLPYCREHGIAFLAYSPLAFGLLSGRMDPDREFKAGDLRRSHPQFSRENRLRIAQALDRLRPLARDRGVDIAQLVIAWTIAQPGVTHALVGIRTEEQARANAAAGDLNLTPDETAQVAEVLGSL
ncbi:MAG: aldo/keto reductase [Acidobacteriota bacterium]